MLEKMKEAHPNVMFIDFDAKSIWDDVMAHPENYGISNTRDACYTGSIIFLKSEPSDEGLRTAMMNEASNNGLSVSPQKIDQILNTPVLREVAKTSWQLNQNLVHDTLDCTGYLFWDDVHPTSYVHQKIAEYALKAIEESGLEFKHS
jgi:phospholipase/lecithinase/hemolysin